MSFATQIADRGDAGARGDTRGVADLQAVAERGVVKNGLAVAAQRADLRGRNSGLAQHGERGVGEGIGDRAIEFGEFGERNRAILVAQREQPSPNRLRILPRVRRDDALPVIVFERGENRVDAVLAGAGDQPQRKTPHSISGPS